jgi:hypothetical protein
MRALHLLVSIPFAFFAIFCFLTAAAFAMVGTIAKDFTVFKDEDFL